MSPRYAAFAALTAIRGMPLAVVLGRGGSTASGEFIAEAGSRDRVSTASSRKVKSGNVDLMQPDIESPAASGEAPLPRWSSRPGEDDDGVSDGRPRPWILVGVPLISAEGQDVTGTQCPRFTGRAKRDLA